MRSARRAGTYDAASAITATSSVIPANVHGSPGLTPYSIVSSRRVATTAATVPMTSPSTASRNPPLTTRRVTALASAPNATRTPISRVRCVTPYAMTA